MAVVACPACDSTHFSWKEMTDHFWESHTLFDKYQRKGECPKCDYPLTKRNLAYHLPCFCDINPESSWLGVSPESQLCPICGEILSTFQGALDHLKEHKLTDKMELLGGTLSCVICGEETTGEDHFSSHVKCLIEHIAVPYDSEGTYECPSCEVTAADEGKIEWHLWTDHFDAQGGQTSCPGCEKTITFGKLKEHLLCLKDGYGPAVANLFDFKNDGCFVCNTSFLNPIVLERHIHNTHLQKISGPLDKCKECGYKIEANKIRQHYLCMAATLDSEVNFGDQPTWICPLCNHPTHSQGAFLDHLETSHNLNLFVANRCRVCNSTLDELTQHESCLNQFIAETVSDDTGLAVPAALQNRPPTRAHSAETTIEKQEMAAYYRGLEGFVEKERQAARDRGWHTYKTIPLWQLEEQKKVIPDLVSLGTQFHPRFDLQFTFEHSVPEEEPNPDDLIAQFGIYPGQKVIVGADTSLQGFPMEAKITFVDDQTLGLSPEPQRSYGESELRDLFINTQTLYHVFDLLTPTPYDRKLKAIRDVKEIPEIHDILCGNTKLEEKPRDVGTFYTGNLNQHQQTAVERALGNPDICCIHGPPGTGKTRTLTAIIELAVARGDRVLACAHSNQAIDNLLVGNSTLNDPDGSSLHSMVVEAPHVTMARAGHHSENIVVQNYYQKTDQKGADIVGATTSAAFELESDSFDLVVIDEATQADQPSSFIPLLKSNQVVLAGDHKQLPPFCSNETDREEDMHISLFERLQNIYGNKIFTRLQKQYRMNEQIATFSSEKFYDGSLEHGEQNRNWTIGDLKPMVGHHITSHEQIKEETKSKYNPREAKIVAQQVRLLQMEGVKAQDIGVITAYSAQVGEIANALKQERIDNCHQIKIDTIDSYQGSEQEAIVVSFVRSNDYCASGFLTFPDEGQRRLNVALTRAKKRLVLVGDFDTLGTVNKNNSGTESCAAVYRDLYEYMRGNGWLKEYEK